MKVRRDMITLAPKRSFVGVEPLHDLLLLKVSLSFALALSVKIEVIETNIEKQIEENEQLPQSMCNTGKVPLNSKQVAKKIGALFTERQSLNLQYSDILDARPHWFWNEDRYVQCFDDLCEYMEIAHRVQVCNDRLTVMESMYHFFNERLDAMHASRLEWIIIVLICVEVFLALWSLFSPHGDGAVL